MAFDFLEFKTFKVLGNEVLGAEFLPSCAGGNNQVCLVSVRHGRAVVMKIDDFNWISIKGIGWMFGGPEIFRSRKDENLMYGLMDEDDAKRELIVSKYLQSINPNAPKILGYKSFREIENARERYGYILDVKHTNGKMVEPCVLYTLAKSPFRMSDVAFFNDKAREEMLCFYSNYFECRRDEYIYKFAYKLGEQIGLFHERGIINDSLYWDNITLWGEFLILTVI